MQRLKHAGGFLVGGKASKPIRPRSSKSTPTFHRQRVPFRRSSSSCSAARTSFLLPMS